jgi:hypothetical protein
MKILLHENEYCFIIMKIFYHGEEHVKENE